MSRRKLRRVPADRLRPVCDRCRRSTSLGAAERDLWNMELRRGVIVGFMCPLCQTPEENAEAMIHQATLDYLGTDELGRVVARPKVEL